MTEQRSRHYLIVGANGMLGTALRCVLTERGEPFLALDRSGLDVTDESSVVSVISAFASESSDGTLLNTAAYTDVERAEDEPERAYRVNEHGAGILASAARAHGLRFIHISTDFVFDGTKDGPYAETDAPNPISVYGASKLAGEIAVAQAYPESLIVRTAWVFGPNGDDFPTKILRLARERDSLRVVDDERGSPTYTLDLASGILGLVEYDARGLFHLAGSGSCTRYELALEVLREACVDVPIVPVSASEFSSKAERPVNSILDCAKARAQGVDMPHWRNALSRFLAATRY